MLNKNKSAVAGWLDIATGIIWLLAVASIFFFLRLTQIISHD
jgi:hypothetical protein